MSMAIVAELLLICDITTLFCLGLQATGQSESMSTAKHVMSNPLGRVVMGRGLVVVGDVGCEDYRTGLEYIKGRRGQGDKLFSPMVVDFENLGGLV